jgi:hypothetical protein
MNTKVKILGLFLFFSAAAILVSQSMGKGRGSDWSKLEVLPEDAEIDYPIALSEREWKQRLGEFEYYVLILLRGHGPAAFQL